MGKCGKPLFLRKKMPSTGKAVEGTVSIGCFAAFPDLTKTGRASGGTAPDA